MLIVEDGVTKKLVCSHCECDNIGESALGESYVHCFKCMTDIKKGSCTLFPVTDEAELAVLQQGAY